jgi:hypothetical protein
MNASTLINRVCSVVPSKVESRTQNPRAVPWYRAEQLGSQEAERAFEAGLKWFLEVSREA